MSFGGEKSGRSLIVEIAKAHTSRCGGGRDELSLAQGSRAPLRRIDRGGQKDQGFASGSRIGMLLRKPSLRRSVT
jgi:hypothetical protein